MAQHFLKNFQKFIENASSYFENFIAHRKVWLSAAITEMYQNFPCDR